MIDQPALFPAGKPVAPLRDLTKRQATIYRLLCQSESGLEPIELGQLMHAQSGRHSADEFCDFCGQDAARALREKAIKQRVIRRVTGVYEPRSAADWTGRAELVGLGSAQLSQLPGESFADIFACRVDESAGMREGAA